MSFVIAYRDTYKRISKSYIQPLNVIYEANIQNGFALCKLIQTYVVTTSDVTEAMYKFPVDYNSAFCDLIIRTPREEIRALVKEKSEAKKIYSEARTQGRQAYLVEESESDRDIYSLSVCNVNLNDEIVMEYTYITELKYTNSSNIFYIPSFISPRYNGSYIPQPKHSVKTIVRIYDKPSEICCIIPDVEISNQNDIVVLTYESIKPVNTDIEIKFSIDHKPIAYKFESNGYQMAMMQFVPTSSSSNIDMEIVFVLDCSGSMEGERIKNSKTAIIHCLKQMINKENYKFNIIKYGNNHVIYSPHMLPTDEKNITLAVEYCLNINADMGGTETLSALQKCLSISGSAILITDGDTSNNDKLHKLCKQFDCLSILGIGSGINRANITDMAELGSGIALFSQSDHDITNNIDILFQNTCNKSLKKYVIDWENDNQSISTTRPVIFNQPNTLYSIIYADTMINNFILEECGINLEYKPYDLSIDVKYLGAIAAKKIIQQNKIITSKQTPVTYFELDIEHFNATGERNMIKKLEKNDNTFTKQKMIELAIAFNIITKYTSMVAVSNIKPEPEKYECIEKYSTNDNSAKRFSHYQNQSNNSYVELCLCRSVEPISRQVGEPICKTINTGLENHATYNCSTASPPLSKSSINFNMGNIINKEKISSFFKPITDFSIKDTYNKIQSIFGMESNDSRANKVPISVTIPFIDLQSIKIAFEHIRPSIPDNLFDYYDPIKQRFSPTIVKIIPNIPDDLLNDSCELSIFILYCLYLTNKKNLYEKCYQLLKENHILNKRIEHFDLKQF